jgi:uncharacterized coiled-coil DUF342 family protein
MIALRLRSGHIGAAQGTSAPLAERSRSQLIKNKQHTMQEILITGLVSLGTAIGGFFFGRRKSIADAQHIEIDNVHQAIEIWRKVAQEMSSEVASLKNRISELQCENRRLSDEIDELRRQLRKLTTDNRRQISKIENQMNKQED